MRLELSGSLIRVNPLIVQFDFDQEINKADYVDLGYTHFEVYCIGAGGTRGGGVDTGGGGTGIRNFGGAGGGGGLQRVRGLLSILPDVCEVVVGQAGINGNDADDAGGTTDGADGGPSAFNYPTCFASGGTGGKRAVTNSDSDSTEANGGEGGVGGSTDAGGGALGGIAGTPAPGGPGTPGTDGAEGTFFRDIGKGGGGGAGGVGNFDGVMLVPGTAGGKGSYTPGDTSVYGPNSLPSDDTFESGAPRIIPGIGGGAKAFPINGLPTQFGKSGFSGAVIIRFTTE